MASPISSVTTGSVLTASVFNDLPRGYVIGATSTSGTQTGITTEVDVTGMSLSVPQLNGRRYLYTGQIEVASAATAVVLLKLTDGTPTTLTQFQVSIPAMTGIGIPIFFWETAASSVTVTRKLRIVRIVGSSTLEVTGSTTMPRQLLCVDVGAS